MCRDPTPTISFANVCRGACLSALRIGFMTDEWARCASVIDWYNIMHRHSAL